MSMSTLLLRAAWLRQSRRDRSALTAPPGFTPSPGRGRVARSVATGILFAAASLTSATTAFAQDKPQPRLLLELAPAEVRVEPLPPSTTAPVRVGGTPPAPCVQVDIAGHRAGHLDCASQTLQEAARVAQAQARSAIDTPVLDAGSPDVRVGVSSLSGSRLRMGNALGNSVHPQRPNRAPSAPRPGGRP